VGIAGELSLAEIADLQKKAGQLRREFAKLRNKTIAKLTLPGKRPA